MVATHTSFDNATPDAEGRIAAKGHAGKSQVEKLTITRYVSICRFTTFRVIIMQWVLLGIIVVLLLLMSSRYPKAAFGTLGVLLLSVAILVYITRG